MKENLDTARMKANEAKRKVEEKDSGELSMSSSRKLCNEKTFITLLSFETIANINQYPPFLGTNFIHLPLACPSCPKRFARTDILRKHIKTHNPCTCAVCGQVFQNKLELGKHQIGVS